MAKMTESNQNDTGKGKKVLIDATTSPEDVLNYNDEGYVIVWDPDDFQELKPTVLSKLRKENKDRYRAMRALAKEVKDRPATDDEVAASIQVTASAGRAETKMDIKNRKKDMSYRWERPDMVDVRLEQGYRFARDVKTLHGSDRDGVHRISAHGQDELIAMEIPKSKLKALREERLRRRQRAIDGVSIQGRSELERLGGNPIGDENDRAEFKPISQEEVTNG